jgi:hypothetical protein
VLQNHESAGSGRAQVFDPQELSQGYWSSGSERKDFRTAVMDRPLRLTVAQRGAAAQEQRRDAGGDEQDVGREEHDLCIHSRNRK